MRRLRVYYSDIEVEESRMRRCSNSPIRYSRVCLGLTFLILVTLVVILAPISVRIFNRPTSEPLARKGEFHIQFEVSSFIFFFSALNELLKSQGFISVGFHHRASSVVF